MTIRKQLDALRDALESIPCYSFALLTKNCQYQYRYQLLIQKIKSYTLSTIFSTYHVESKSWIIGYT
jgi:hypothetical protein